MSPAVSLRFRILGPLEVDGLSGPLGLGGPKQRIVLAHLIIRAGEVVPANALADALWADDPPESSVNVVQTYVSLLRKVLGVDRIIGRSGGYLLRLEPAEVDATRFDALVREARRVLPVRPEVAIGTLDDALALWRGPALSDVAVDPRLLAEAGRLDEEHLAARELRVEAMLAVGQDGRAIAELETLVPDDPLRETLWALRMRALYRQGRQSEALAAYQQLRRLLRDELGIDPSPDLERLHRQVLEQDPSLVIRGQPLRGYRLLERLRGDPDGDVYRALQPSVGRDVAIRVIGEREAMDEAFVRGFERRLEAIAALEHPHVAPIHDFWREDGQAYVVSAYLRGGTLAGCEARGDAFSADRAALLIDEVGSALAHAHHRGVAHGAVAPERIGLDADGHAYLIDFRISADPDPDTRGDILALLTLARRLLPNDAHLQATLQRLGDDAPDIRADDVVAAVRASLGLADPTTPAGIDTRNPYKGLRPFGEIDAGDFHGREHVTRQLLARLREPGPQARFLAVVGPSGSGKSSLVRAGLVPVVRSGALHRRDGTFVTEMFPGRHPFDELAASLARVAPRGDAPSRETLESDDRGLLETVSAILPDDAELMLIVDQLEELFTTTAHEAERARFLEALRVAAVDPASRMRVIVTLRADFYDRPLLYPRFGELLAARNEAVVPLAADELEAAIRRPAEAVGARLEPGLISAMIADTAHQPGALPLLQYALTEVFDRRADGILTMTGYQAIGTLGGAISTRADQVHGGFDSRQREATRQVFLRLVTLGEGREDTRRRVGRSELASVVGDHVTLDEILEAYGRHRLLTFDRDPASREPTVEIAHESLLTHWSRLRGWIDAAREDLRLEATLARAASEWHSSGDDPSFLLHGARLEQLGAWSTSTSLTLDHRTRAYLNASHERWEADRRAELERERREMALERRSRSRLRALVAVLSVAALLLAVISILALGQAERAARESRVARARELAAASGSSIGSDPDRAILLAIEAVEATRTADATVIREAEGALHRAISASRAVASIPAAGGVVAWGPGGLVAAAALEIGAIELRDERTWSVARAFDAHDGSVTDLAFSPAGRWLASAGEDGRLRLWDLPMAGPGIVLWDGDGGVDDVSFSGDGGRVVAAWPAESTVRVFEIGDRSLVRAFPIREPGVTALSPDGRRLIVSAPADDPVGRTFEVETGTRGPDLLAAGLDVHVQGAAWSPDGDRIATAGTGGIDLWHGSTLKHEARIPDFGWVSRVAWSPLGDRIAIGGTDDPTVRVVQIEGDADAMDIELRSFETSLGIQRLAFSADGDRVIARGYDGDTAKVWDLRAEAGAELLSVPTIDQPGDVAFSADGGAIVAADTDGRLRDWDLATGTASASIGYRVGQHSFELSPDGTALAMPLFQNGVAAWEMPGGRPMFHVRELGWVDEVAWSHDGNHLVASVHLPGARTLVLDRSGAVVATFSDPEGSPYSAAFEPGDTLVAVTGFPDEGGGITFWDWRRDEVVRRIPASPAGMLAFAPDGGTVATGYDIATVVDVVTGKPSITLDGHPTPVADIAYSPDGTRIAAVLPAGEIRLFDARTGELDLVLDPGDGRFMARLAFSPDGSMLASQSVGLVRVWALDVDDLLAIARSKVTRRLSSDECRRFLHVDACPSATASTPATDASESG